MKVEVVDNLPADAQPVPELTFPEAMSLADWYGVSRDFEFAINSLEELRERGEQRETRRDRIVRISLFNNALMLYRRCFDATGVREHLSPSDIHPLGTRYVELDERLRGLADCFVAHSVNEMEGNSVGALIGHGKVVDLLPCGHRADGLKEPSLSRCIDALRHIQKHVVAPKLSAAKAVALALAQAMPLAEIVKGKPVGPIQPGRFENLRKGRQSKPSVRKRKGQA